MTHMFSIKLLYPFPLFLQVSELKHIFEITFSILLTGNINRIFCPVHSIINVCDLSC